MEWMCSGEKLTSLVMNDASLHGVIGRKTLNNLQLVFYSKITVVHK